jgi:hypothetical protein
MFDSCLKLAAIVDGKLLCISIPKKAMKNSHPHRKPALVCNAWPASAIALPSIAAPALAGEGQSLWLLPCRSLGGTAAKKTGASGARRGELKLKLSSRIQIPVAGC